MATIAAGNHVEVYVPLAGDITITPGTGGYVEFGCSSPSGESAPEGRRLYAAAAIAIPAGSTMFLRAEGEDATYTDPATGGGVVTSYTAAQLSALAAAGGLTPGAIYVTSDGGDAYFATSASTYTSLLAGSIVFSSAALSASAVVKGVSGDPGNFVGILCTSVAGGKATIRDGGSVAGALIPGLGAGGASGLTLTAGQYYSLGAAVYCANGIFLEISGTGTYVCLYQ